MNKNLLNFLLVFTLTIPFLQNCHDKEKDLVILSGSENESIEPILKNFESETGIRIEMKYKGSVDIMMELGNETSNFDAIWPASTLWISLGDKSRKVKHIKSIMTSPVAFGIRKSLAEELGFAKRDVRVKDILAAIRTKKLKFIMTSATQSNSGTSAYLGFLYALLGNPDVITEEDLSKESLRKDMKELLNGINRSSGSSGWLKELFLSGKYDAMVNYESLLIETNQTLVSQGKEPLYIVYPKDGIVISDSPLGFVNSGNPKKEESFKKLQDYLLSEKIQKQILNTGRRVGFGGTIEDGDKSVFNPNWGIDSKRILSPIQLPSADMIRKALSMYQTEFRKSSYTVFCLDFSDSMLGTGERQLKEAMDLLLDKEKATRYFLDFSKDDKIVVIIFSHITLAMWTANGNNPDEIKELNAKIQGTLPNGATDIYSPIIAALKELKDVDNDEYSPAVIVMTDGISNSGKNFKDVSRAFKKIDKDIPVFPIMFGDASEDQLKEIAELTRAKVFDGRSNLIQAFKTAKGYN
ncbi:MAG TPA: VWA domain-containing protein [Leptospiraceae bacterium]|nr:VWA domain-containing protein [Leptospiraceae bacterium]HMW07121.1 VWA domain-containing protein [Leptospiraceae bacterium]HMX31795.1 VWA domain-containing protein [Leptospiraceae bacterium]HMY32562.1 VWA domain-containing protein [Leptospiraceae bacterium]HMZ63904.1 VWA domain-containing protein [Leptospiraceae bacterium]